RLITGSMSQRVLSRSKAIARTLASMRSCGERLAGSVTAQATHREDSSMAEFTLLIGDKNYSSWSLRAWILLKHMGLDFEEQSVRLDTPGFRDEVARFGPSGRVPVLLHGDLRVWDSIAICEYVAEITGRAWPRVAEARALARCV